MERRIRVGVVGLGMGRFHVKGYQADPRAEVVAACDTNAERLKAVGAECGIGALYTDLGRMLREAKLDAVSLATPNALHAPMTIAAARAGLHVLCEKPMAMTVREAEAMRAAARRARRNLMINFSYRFTDMSQALKRQVEAGVIGEIYYGRTVWHRRRGIPGFGSWFTRAELAGGGPLFDLGVHRLDLALWLMGYPEPVVVSGATHTGIAGPLAARQKKAYTVEDVACGLVRFANGATLIVEASWALNIPEREHMLTQLCGTRGGLVQKNVGGGYQFAAEIYTEEPGGLFTKALDQGLPPSPSAYQEFISSIVECREPSAGADHGVKVMKILEGIYRSARTGRDVRYRG
jgi:predicted dehydrogenase